MVVLVVWYLGVVGSDICIIELEYVLCLLCLLLLVIWITNYRKCTLSYIECKLRGVKKEDGIIYNIMSQIYDVNKKKYKYIIYIFIFTVMCIHFEKLKRIK